MREVDSITIEIFEKSLAIVEILEQFVERALNDGTIDNEILSDIDAEIEIDLPSNELVELLLKEIPDSNEMDLTEILTVMHGETLPFILDLQNQGVIEIETTLFYDPYGSFICRFAVASLKSRPE